MRCEDAQQYLSQQLDGELPSDLRSPLAEHVAGCPACQGLRDRVQTLDQFLGDAPVPSLDETYWAKLTNQTLGQAAKESGARGRGPRLFRVLSYVSVAASVALLAGLVVQQQWIARLQTEVRQLGARPEALRPSGVGPTLRLASQAGSALAAEQTEAFGVLGEYFRGDLKWMVQDGSQAELGLGQRANGQVASGAPMLFVEIYVQRFDPSGTRTVSAPTLVIAADQEAGFRLADTNGRGPKRFRYRCVTTSGADGQTRVHVILDLTDPEERTPLRLSGGVRLGERSDTPVAYCRTGSGGYALFVSAQQRQARPPSGSRT
jgi:putative zinc finger protein